MQTVDLLACSIAGFCGDLHELCMQELQGLVVIGPLAASLDVNTLPQQLLRE